MRRISTFALSLGLITALSGCLTSPPPSRGGTGAQSLISGAATDYNVQQINVIVPRSLRVSEANTIKPSADIVWHGEAFGDRHAQVGKIVQDAMNMGTTGFRAGRGVVLDVQLQRFHALTPRTRVSIGGKHELFYSLTIRDLATDEVLMPARKVNATVRGSGGAQARAEEAAGRSEMVVIREALAASIQKELGQGAASKGGTLMLVSRSDQSPVTLPAK